MAEQPLHPHWVSEASFPSFCDGEGNKKANGEGVEENKREENLIAPRPVLFSFIFFLGWTVRICGVREKTSPIHCQQTGPGPSGCVRDGAGQDRPINLARDGLMKENEKKKSTTQLQMSNRYSGTCTTTPSPSGEEVIALLV